MTKFAGPSYYYGPDGEAKIFHDSDEVPAGWLDDPKKHKAKPEVVQKPEDVLGMTKAEIVAALNEGGIAFQKNASAKTLHDLLRASVITALTEAGTEFDPQADTKALYGLLTPPE